MDLSVLIVSHNTASRTLDCLRSLERETRGMECEVLVLDNASVDGSVAALREHFPDLYLDAQTENLGFARGVNRLARRARGEFLLLLNPDTVVLEGAIRELLACARATPGPAITGGRTRKPDGTPDPGFAWGRSTPWSTLCQALGLTALFRGSALFDPEGVGQRIGDGVHEVDIVSGCFLLIPRSLWEQLGGFDPGFFVYGEDADLCLRARRLGIPRRVTSRAVVLHHGGASEASLAAKQTKLLAARRRLMALHWPPGRARLGARLLWLQVALRAVGYTVLAPLFPSRRTLAAQWRAVFRDRSQWLAPSPTFPAAGADAPRAVPESPRPQSPQKGSALP